MQVCTDLHLKFPQIFEVIREYPGHLWREQMISTRTSGTVFGVRVPMHSSPGTPRWTEICAHAYQLPFTSTTVFALFRVQVAVPTLIV